MSCILRSVRPARIASTRRRLTPRHTGETCWPPQMPAAPGRRSERGEWRRSKRAGVARDDGAFVGYRGDELRRRRDLFPVTLRAASGPGLCVVCRGTLFGEHGAAHGGRRAIRGVAF